MLSNNYDTSFANEVSYCEAENEDYVLSNEGKEFIGLYVDAFLQGITGSTEILSEYHAELESLIVGLEEVNSLSESIYFNYLRVGKQLARIKIFVNCNPDLKWESYCKENVKLSSSMIRRCCNIASVNIDKKYYHIGYSKMSEIIEGRNRVTGKVDINDVLEFMNFDEINKTECSQAASNVCNKILSRNMSIDKQVGIESRLIDNYIDSLSKKKKIDFNTFVNDMVKVPYESREEKIDKLISSGKKSLEEEKDKKEKEKKEERIIDVNRAAADLIMLLKSKNNRLDPSLYNDLMISLENYMNFNA